MKITVIDSIMGAGKTTFLFDLMNNRPNENWVYIGVTLDEVERCINQCPRLKLQQPVKQHGRKYNSLVNLVQQGANITTTHELFRHLETGLYNLLKGMGYNLVIDEALAVVEPYDDVKRDDLDMLFRDGKLFLEDKGDLSWNYEACPEYDGKFASLMPLCQNGNLVQVRDGALMWTFPHAFRKRCVADTMISC